MVELKHIGVMSAAKIGAVVVAVVAVIVIILGFIFNAAGIYGIYGSSAVPVVALGVLGMVLTLVVGLIAGLIVGFILIAIMAWLYNIVAGKVGGLIVTFAGGKLSNINPLRAAIISTVLALIAMVVYAVIFGLILGSFAATAGGMVGATGAATGGIVELLVVVIIGVPVLAFVTTAVAAFLYNIFAKSVGGIVVKFNKDELVMVGPLSYAIMAALIGIVEAIISSIVAYVGLSTFLPGILSAILPGAGAMTLNITASAIAVGIVVAVVGAAIKGFVDSGIMAVVYNWLQPKVGGVELDFR